ncbi:hypothetical protein DY000_02048216 [Brassica cretica]|uniref:Uncharacterized protein n=1 Tax=Brassica cretica TaxID=69181 RepID=A0ABQ7EZ91_BRACR|nr:hypothetical protein DY000_02048216 [Brassica cretica]
MRGLNMLTKLTRSPLAYSNKSQLSWDGSRVRCKLSLMSTIPRANFLLLDLRSQLSHIDLEKVSIDAINKLSIDTPFRPSIDTTTELSIDVPSSKV